MEQEVNKDVELKYIEPAGDDEELIVDETQKETESSSSEDEQPAESDDAQPAEETDSEETEQVEQKEEIRGRTVQPDIKRLPNETDREYALRREVTRLKRERKEERKQDLKFEDTQTPKPNPDVLSKYNPDELKSFEEVFDALAEKKGYVRKDEVTRGTFDDVKDQFLEEHPEYLPENDPDDVMWKALTSELGEYKPPTNAKDLKRLLTKAHNAITGIRPDTALKSVKAQQEKIKVASHAGSQAGGNKSKATIANPDLYNIAKSALKGFSEEEISELFD